MSTSADLRERVARAIYESRMIPGDFHWDDLDAKARAYWLQDADAVLAELGLTQAEPVAREAAVLVSYMDHAAFDSSALPAGMAASLRRLRAMLAAAPQPQPQASAEDVALVDIAMRGACDELMGRPHMAAWQRLKGLLGVGHG
jgi:hypothetical protein